MNSTKFFKFFTSNKKKMFEALAKDDFISAIKYVAQGANVNWIFPKSSQTALHKVAADGHLLSSVWLVQNDAKLDVRDGLGQGPLDIARAHEHMLIERWLVKKGAV